MNFYRLNLHLKSVKKVLVCLILLISTQNIIAQSNSKNIKIEGIILDKKNKPISDVSIILKNTSFGAASDKKGNFHFYASKGHYTLLVSVLGFKNVEKKITLSNNDMINLNIKLDNSSENLHEIIINGQSSDHNVILESSSATKSNMKLMQTPAPVVVIGKAILNQQSNTTIQESIRNVSGLTQSGNNYGIGDNLAIRGLEANYTYDGMYAGGGLGNNYNPTRSLTNIEQIEVVKGPVTGLYGIGSAGGVINMIEKKPLDYKQINVALILGQWEHYRGMVDVTCPINEKLSYRAIAAIENEEGFRGVSSKRYEGYGALRFNSGIHDLNLSIAYIDDENQIDSTGEPLRLLTLERIDGDITDWQNLVNDTSTDENGDLIGLQLTDAQRQELANSLVSTDGLEPFDLGDGNLISPISTPNDGQELRVKLNYNVDLLENFTCTNQAQFRRYQSDFTRQTGALNYAYYENSGTIHNGARSPLIIDDILYPYAARRQEYRHQEVDEKSYQFFTDAKYDWNISEDVKGEHLLSGFFEKRDLDYKSWSIWDADGQDAATAVPYILDIRNPNWSTGNFWDYDPTLRSNYDKDLETWGISFQEVLYVNNVLTARLGAAYNGIKQIYQDNILDSDTSIATPEADTNDSGLTYNVGANFQPIEEISLFSNYAKGRTAYSITGSVTGQDDRPDSESESIDLGLRTNFLNKSLFTSLVFFRTSRTNIRYSNENYDDNVDSETFNISVAQYFFDEANQTEGVELDINYVYNDNLSLNANATYQEPITVRVGEETGQTKGVPKRFARFWSEYKHYFGKSKFPVRFNLGVKHQSERTIDGYSLTNAHVDSYVVFDAGLAFDIKKWNLRFNLDNLLNEKYYSIAMFAGALPGEERNIEFTLSRTF